MDLIQENINRLSHGSTAVTDPQISLPEWLPAETRKEVTDTAQQAAQEAAVAYLQYAALNLDESRFRTLAWIGIPQDALDQLRQLNRIPLAGTNTEIGRQVTLINLMPPWVENRTTPDLGRWLYDQRHSHLTLRKYGNPADTPLTTLLESVCRKINRALQTAGPEMTEVFDYLTQASNAERKPTVQEGYGEWVATARYLGRLQPETGLHSRYGYPYLTCTRYETPQPIQPENSRREPSPNNPLLVENVIKAAQATGLIPNPQAADLGCLQSIPELADNPNFDIGKARVSQDGTAWYRSPGPADRNGGNLLQGGNQASSCLPADPWTEKCPEDITASEARFARQVSPAAPFPEADNGMILANTLRVLAFNNRATPEMTAAALAARRHPDQPENAEVCPESGKCPTPCGYVQRAGVIPFTLYDDGRFEQCRYLDYRRRYHGMPASTRNHIIATMLQNTETRSKIGKTPPEERNDADSQQSLFP